MKTTKIKYAAVLAIMALSVLACTAAQGLFGGADQSDSDAAPASADIPEAAETGRFFNENFTGTLPGWRDYILGEGDQAHTSIVDGQFIFDIQSENTFAYTIYEAETYANVSLTANVENQGHEDNYFTLVCRYTADGWYEFNVASDGFWAIFAYEESTGGFISLADGTSEAINLGLASNELTAVCQADQLSLYINGELISTVADDLYADGFIGISVASFGNLPVRVAFDSLEVSQP